MLTMRPDLFGAIVCRVPLLDMQRYHKLLAGASWVAEFGRGQRAAAVYRTYINQQPANQTIRNLNRLYDNMKNARVLVQHYDDELDDLEEIPANEANRQAYKNLVLTYAWYATANIRLAVLARDWASEAKDDVQGDKLAIWGVRSLLLDIQGYLAEEDVFFQDEIDRVEPPNGTADQTTIDNLKTIQQRMTAAVQAVINFLTANFPAPLP